MTRMTILTGFILLAASGAPMAQDAATAAQTQELPQREKETLIVESEEPAME
jgi:hypothetical protein